MIVLAAFAVSLGLYFLFAGQANDTEIAAGLPASAIVAAFVWLQRRRQAHPLRLHAPWSRILLKPLASLVWDSIRVSRMLLRAMTSPAGVVAGMIDQQPFHPGGDRAADAGRRGVVALASSFAPNGFVVDIPPSIILGDAELLLMHRLAPSPPVPDAEWPI